MNEEEFLLLKNIASSLERIADSLEKNENNEVNDKVDVAVESSEDNHENADMDSGCSIKEIDVSILIDKLQEKNITVKTYVDSFQENTSLDNIAYFMGNRYKDIRKVYETIKRHLNKPNGFHLDLKNSTQSEISASCQLCTTLYDIAFLSEYKYDKSPRYFIHATPNKIPIAINFLTGHWLEVFIRKTIQDSLKSLPVAIEYTYLINPQIILPNGNDFELDVVFLINGEIYWVEGKTGNYQNYINKYSHVANMLNLDKNHSFLVLTDVINPNTIYILSKTFDMTIIPVEEFEEEIKYVFHENLMP